MSFDCEIVGKIGSMALINREINELDYNTFSRIGKYLSPGYVWISSGAVEIGKIDYFKRNNCKIIPENDIAKSLYASQGQCILIENYRRFIRPDYSVRQILLEHNHFNDNKKREYIKNLLLKSVEQKAIPIINYNDSVSNDEIMKMEISRIRDKNESIVECIDNDETASQISVLLKSKYLLIMTAADGLLKKADDPSSLIGRVEGKDTYELIENINNLLQHCIGSSREGSNGMLAKLRYIQEPIKNGTTVIIGSPKYIIPDLIKGNVKRTIFSVR
ncbi:MAG: uridylate kinase [Clostridiales bacterium GWF2_38_85]|nr:MAG: uridylate kinase [Clostridiales bacterium GWF2_38_85]HBL83635.1 uridylate kinase [Clostridiales bacterium]